MQFSARRRPAGGVRRLDSIIRSRGKLTKDFEFTDTGHTFYCTVEAPRHAGMAPWWWFRIDTDSATTRYAPFEASAKDTQKSVQARIIAYYAELLAIKARPVHQRPTWQRPVRVPVVPVTEATPAAVPATTSPVAEAAPAEV